MTDSKRKRRWFQFSLRTLLVFVTLCAFLCSWIAVKMREAERERKEVEAIKTVGAEVEYDWRFDNHHDWIPSEQPFGPHWLRSFLGDNFFSTVKAVYFYRAHVTDADLENLEGLTEINLLWLIDTKVTDAGLEHLKGLNQLQRLRLERTKVTDEGIKRLQQELPHCSISR